MPFVPRFPADEDSFPRLLQRYFRYGDNATLRDVEEAPILVAPMLSLVSRISFIERPMRGIFWRFRSGGQVGHSWGPQEISCGTASACIPKGVSRRIIEEVLNSYCHCLNTSVMVKYLPGFAESPSENEPNLVVYGVRLSRKQTQKNKSLDNFLMNAFEKLAIPAAPGSIWQGQGEPHCTAPYLGLQRLCKCLIVLSADKRTQSLWFWSTSRSVDRVIAMINSVAVTKHPGLVATRLPADESEAAGISKHPVIQVDGYPTGQNPNFLEAEFRQHKIRHAEMQIIGPPHRQPLWSRELEEAIRLRLKRAEPFSEQPERQFRPRSLNREGRELEGGCALEFDAVSAARKVLPMLSDFVLPSKTRIQGEIWLCLEYFLPTAASQCLLFRERVHLLCSSNARHMSVLKWYKRHVATGHRYQMIEVAIARSQFKQLKTKFEDLLNGRPILGKTGQYAWIEPSDDILFDEWGKWLEFLTMYGIYADLATQKLRYYGPDTAFDKTQDMIQDIIANQECSVNFPVVVKRSCPICLEEADKQAKDTWIALPCGHQYCPGCFVKICDMESDSLQNPLAYCPVCKWSVPIEILHYYLPSKTFDHLLDRAIEGHYLSAANSKSLLRCPSNDCTAFLDPNGGGVITCPECGSFICADCEQRHDETTSCTAAQPEISAKKEAELKAGGEAAGSEQSTYKQCPNCEAWLARIDGCNHVCCKRCLSHLCWLCMASFDSSKKTYSHLGAVHGGAWNFADANNAAQGQHG